MRKPLSPALCVLLTTCNHDPEAYIPHREMAGLSGSFTVCVCVFCCSPVCVFAAVCVCVCVYRLRVLWIDRLEVFVYRPVHVSTVCNSALIDLLYLFMPV